MISQRIKDLGFQMARPLAYMNGWRWRLLPGLPRRQPLWVNIGSGEHPIPGFLNVEGNPFARKDLWLDLRNSWPFPSASIDALYACHVLEHFYLDELRHILRESHRVLKAGNGIRILVPSLELAIKAYQEGRKEWFSDFPMPFRSMGGRFYNLIFCAGQHRGTFDTGFMQELLQEAGFSRAQASRPGHSEIFPMGDLSRIEAASPDILPVSLVIEAFK